MKDLLACWMTAMAVLPSQQQPQQSDVVLPQILVCDVPKPVIPILTDRYQGRALLRFEADMSDQELLSACLSFEQEKGRSLDAIVVRSANTVSSDMIQKLSACKVTRPPTIKAIGRAGVGCDNIDLQACQNADLPVVTAAGANAVAVAEHTLALVLALARKLKPAMGSVADGRWERPFMTGTGLRGKTMGVVGFGTIGAEVASVCSKLGMHVLVAPPFTSSKNDDSSSSSQEDTKLIQQRQQRVADTGAEQVSDLEELLRRSDVVSVHLPLTDATRYCIGKPQLDLMKKTAFLVSTARGGVVDETALLHCLKHDDGIAGAALDVFESEGPRLSEDKVLMELAQLDTTAITPHLAGHTTEAQIDVWTLVIDRLLEIL